MSQGRSRPAGRAVALAVYGTTAGTLAVAAGVVALRSAGPWWAAAVALTVSVGAGALLARPWRGRR